LVDLAATYDTATGTVAISWDDGVAVNGLPGDYVSFLVFNNDTRTFETSSYSASQRSDESDGDTIDTGLTATDLYVVAVVSAEEAGTEEVELISDAQVVQCTAAP
jgi:hypothetical protein